MIQQIKHEVTQGSIKLDSPGFEKIVKENHPHHQQVRQRVAGQRQPHQCQTTQSQQAGNHQAKKPSYFHEQGCSQCVCQGKHH